VYSISEIYAFADPIIVHKLHVAGSNAYLLESQTEVFMIDSGWPNNEEQILKEITEIGKPLKLIILTHSHIDHFGSALRIKEQTGCIIAIHSNDSKYLATGQTPIEKTDFFGFWGKLLLPIAESVFQIKGIMADKILQDNESIVLDGHEVHIIHTPGHTPGSCCILIEQKLFVGDLLSTNYGLEKQSKYSFDWNEIDQSTKKLLQFEFKEIYPGHGERSSSKEELIRLVEKMD
jgi:hydroxyacylglutathione hydrolase